MGNNQYQTQPLIHVSATISHEFWTALRELQKQGYKEANWTNVMRRGARLVLDCAEGNDPYEKIKRLVKKLEEVSQNNLEQKDGVDEE